jgi:predicted metal-dependent enzyme (double-stranded beta helix superfamily)
MTNPAADLTRPELLRLVEELATDDSRWRHLVHHDADRRTYEQVMRDDRVGVWLICWMNDHDTGFHDHDISAGAVAVVQGRVLEERLTLGSGPARRIYAPGEAFDFAASDIHRMSHAGGGPAISIHAYSPPLWRMGAYSIDPTGVVSRTSISYAEELRPLEPAVEPHAR